MGRGPLGDRGPLGVRGPASAGQFLKKTDFVIGLSAQVCLPAGARAFTHMWSTRPWLNKEDRFDRVKQALVDTDADLIFIDEPGLFTDEAFF